MALGPHDGLGYPEVFPLQSPDIVQAEGYLVGGQGLPLAAPDGVVVVGGDIQLPGYPGVVHMLSQTSAGEVVYDGHAGYQLPQKPRLEGGEFLYAVAAETLPVQPQGRIVSGDGGGGQGYLVKVVVLLGPESGAVGLVKGADIPPELVPKIEAEGVQAAGAIAHVAVLMAELVVYLPGRYGLLALIVLRHGPDDALGIGVHLPAVEAVHMAAAEAALCAVFKLRQHRRVLLCQPGGYGRRGGAHDYRQAPGLGPLYHMVKEREVVPALRLFHDMPAKLRNAYGVAAQLAYIVQVGLQHGGRPAAPPDYTPGQRRCKP